MQLVDSSCQHVSQAWPKPLLQSTNLQACMHMSAVTLGHIVQLVEGAGFLPTCCSSILCPPTLLSEILGSHGEETIGVTWVRDLVDANCDLVPGPMPAKCCFLRFSEGLRGYFLKGLRHECVTCAFDFLLFLCKQKK